MKKPLIYYQFDYEKFRRGNYQEGYYSYNDDGFGPVCNEVKNLVFELQNIVDHKFQMDDKYVSRVNSFFAYHDDRNCERTFEAVLQMK